MLKEKGKQAAGVKLLSSSRRFFLGNIWTWFRVLIFGIVLYPLIRFINHSIPPRPREIRITKVVKIGGFLLEKEFVLFMSVEGPFAVSRKCTHMGCCLEFLALEEQFVCPCHQSRFAMDGRRLAGPARLDLPRLTVRELDNLAGYVVTL